MDDLPSHAALDTVRALLSDDHSAEAGDAAVRDIIGRVLRTHGVEGVTDLAAELASRLAAMVEGVASGVGLTAFDLVDVLFVDGMARLPDRVRPPSARIQETRGEANRFGT
ncbi:MAG TPA: hypothetical protein VGE11_18095 [Pseudonocardia sp.]